MLDKRFGNKQLVISSHVKKLLDLDLIDAKNTKGLRTLYDKIETEVRSLDALGCDSANYGTMLIPIIMTKLPQDIKLVLSRKFDDNIWELRDILKELEKELSAREKVTETDENFEGSNFSAQALFSGNGNRRKGNFEKTENLPKNDQLNKKSAENDLICIFCRQDHYSKNCDIITKPEVRKEILVRESRCFLCMKTGHSASKCRKNWKCQKCNGRHNTAICVYSQKRNFENNSNFEKKSEKKSENAEKNCWNGQFIKIRFGFTTNG